MQDHPIEEIRSRLSAELQPEVADDLTTRLQQITKAAQVAAEQASTHRENVDARR